MNHLSSFIIAGTHSGCGKTTVSLGLMAALTLRGYTVQPFKVGPDFIDPGHHTQITGRTSENLDGWMLDRETNHDLFRRMGQEADVIVGEGVMGLFDGFSGSDEAGSTAQMAKWLGVPVLLVVDARSMARSAAAMVHGYTSFDPDLRFAGVVLNRVGSPGHARMLRQALRAAGGPPCLGCLPRQENLSLPSRHLGLMTAEDAPASQTWIQALGHWVDEHVHCENLLADTRMRGDGPQSQAWVQTGTRAHPRKQKVRIGVARDQAFCFYYPQNLRLLQQAGAELIFFSPIQDTDLPEDLGGIYLGGGYPELHAAALAGNRGLRSQMRGFAQGNGPMYAECGGFMYCMQDLIDVQGQRHSMLGLFPFQARMDIRLRALGYREVQVQADSLLGPAGISLRGHEFHYSSIEEETDQVEQMYTLSDRLGKAWRQGGYRVFNVLGSYVHLHFASNPQTADHFVHACRSHFNQG